jgi:peptide/nickel transport system substrate-binding protein
MPAISEQSGAGRAAPGDPFDSFLREWSRRDFLRRLGSVAALSAFVAGGGELLEACANGGGAGAAPKNPVRGGTLVEGQTFDIATLNPFLAVDGYSQLLAAQLFDPLMAARGNGDPVPILASASPRISSDGTTYTFSLRKDAMWTDGQPITSDDVAWSFGLTFDPRYRAFKYPGRATAEAGIRSVSAPDPYTFVVQFARVDPSFAVGATEFGILPKHVLGSISPADLNTASFNSKPTVTSGPFKLNRWDQGQQLVFDRNPNHYRGPAYLSTYVFKVLGQASAAVDGLMTGELDLAVVTDPGALSQVRGAPNLSTTVLPTALGNFLAYQLNPSRPGSRLFADKRVRQALFSALDLAQIVKAVYFGQADPGLSVEPPTSWAFTTRGVPRYGYDPQKAASLLDAAGWKLNSSGVRENNGAELSFELQLGNQQVTIALATAIQEAWKKIGVNVTLKPLASAAYLNALRTQKDFTALIGSILWGADPDVSRLYLSNQTGPGGANSSGYQNPQLDAIFNDALDTTDREKRRQLYAQAQQILMDDLPEPPLLWQKQIWTHNKRVQGLQLGTYSLFRERYWMNEVWVSDGR